MKLKKKPKAENKRNLEDQIENGRNISLFHCYSEVSKPFSICEFVLCRESSQPFMLNLWDLGIYVVCTNSYVV